MLTQQEIDTKAGEINGDVVYIKGHAVPKGCAWEVILKAPDVLAWEAYQRHKQDPAAVYAFILSMLHWCGSDALTLPSGDVRAAFTAIRSRFVGMPEAISNHPAFLQFIGLEAETLEK